MTAKNCANPSIFITVKELTLVLSVTRGLNHEAQGYEHIAVCPGLEMALGSPPLGVCQSFVILTLVGEHV